jgi:argininosuccinate synthase
MGAVRAHVLDVREEFASDFALPALQAGAVYEGCSVLSTALSRPLIAKHLVEIAHIEGAKTIAHGGAATGNDQVRMEVSARALDPSLTVIAPARRWSFSSADAIEYGRAHGIPPAAGAAGPWAAATNLWGRAIEGGAADDPWDEAAEDLYLLTKPPAEAPDTPAYVELEFVRGVPARINGVEMGLVELIQSLETIAGAHGIGRGDAVENQLVGAKVRAVYEAPAAVVLHAAHHDLQAFVTPRELMRLTSNLGVTYADLIYNGLWHTATREAIDALVAKVQEKVTGSVRLRFFKAGCHVVGRKSPHALYDRAVEDSFSAGLDRGAGDGFAKIWGLPSEMAARRPRQAPKAAAASRRSGS